MESNKGKENKSNLIKDLANCCLEFKWIEYQTQNTFRLKDPCTFCQQVFYENKDCSQCLCPQYLCSDNGLSGLVGFYYRKYGNIELSRLDSRDYEFILEILREIANNGEVSKDLKEEVEILIRNQDYL